MFSIPQLVAQIESGERSLLACLSAHVSLSQTERFDLLLADQRHRRVAGMLCCIDYYSRTVPELLSNSHLRVRLIAEEFFLQLGSASTNLVLRSFASKYEDEDQSLVDKLQEKIKLWNQQPLALRKFDELCDRFEDALLANHTPKIEDWVELTPAASHDDLIAELIRIESYQYSQLGIPIDWENYCSRFPVQQTMILQLKNQFRALHPPKENKPGSSVTSPSPDLSDLTGSFLSSYHIGDLRNGRYRFTRKLGQGTYGSVYLASDVDLKRNVAIKLPSKKALDRVVDVESYLIEAQNVAALDHPNIVPVFDVGRTLDGSIYIVTKFIDGCSLAARIKLGIMDVVKTASVLRVIADALHHAHEKRIIHRDVKPANILIDAKTETPYLTDFGLAIREEHFVNDGSLAGTPAYMSPEQIAGGKSRIDGRSDLFSLGVVMYQLLTGYLPFEGTTAQEITRKVLISEPIPPRIRNPSLPERLETICLKLLRKSVSERYDTGHDLAIAIKEFLDIAQNENADPFPPNPPTIKVFSESLMLLETNKHLDVTIGSAASCNLLITGKGVSRRHCRLKYERGQWHVEDLNSTNGTLLDGKRINRQAPLPSFCVLQVGIRKLKLQTLTEPSTDLVDPDALKSNDFIHREAQAVLVNEQPAMLGDYLFEKLIGAGSVGKVYLAYDVVKKEQLAVKVIQSGRDLSNSARLQFFRDMQIAADMQHPSIIEYTRFGEQNGKLYIAMDYCNAGNLGELLSRNGPLSIRRAVKLTLRLLEGLAYAHDQGIVHGDLKPSNILLQKNEHGKYHPRIGDFGLKKSYSNRRAQVHRQPGQLRKAGFILLTNNSQTPARYQPQVMYGAWVQLCTNV
jgi:serine/threonine protein kinase